MHSKGMLMIILQKFHTEGSYIKATLFFVQRILRQNKIVPNKEKADIRVPSPDITKNKKFIYIFIYFFFNFQKNTVGIRRT